LFAEVELAGAINKFMAEIWGKIGLKLCTGRLDTIR
jgi:hypothetical protein